MTPHFLYTWYKLCYDSKLGSGYNLGKGLSKRGEDDQLVKHKDTDLNLQLYILNDYSERRRHL